VSCRRAARSRRSIHLAVEATWTSSRRPPRGARAARSPAGDVGRTRNKLRHDDGLRSSVPSRRLTRPLLSSRKSTANVLVVLRHLRATEMGFRAQRRRAPCRRCPFVRRGSPSLRADVAIQRVPFRVSSIVVGFTTGGPSAGTSHATRRRASHLHPAAPSTEIDFTSGHDAVVLLQLPRGRNRERFERCLIGVGERLPSSVASTRASPSGSTAPGT
jgi:hypothetical protein